MAAVLTTTSPSALSWSVLQAIKERILGGALAFAFLSLPLLLLLPGISIPALVLSTLVLGGMWRLSRRLAARYASTSLATGETRRAHRLYWLLWATSLSQEERRASRLSLAACLAAGGNYEQAIAGVSQLQAKQEGALQAVAFNLWAYCLGRQERDLQNALAMSELAMEMRPQVAGFRHTRGMLLLQLGRLDDAARDLEETWKASKGKNALLESERCFDLGRLWQARGQAEYANDYFKRAVRASPESRWAEASRPHLQEPEAGGSAIVS